MSEAAGGSAAHDPGFGRGAKANGGRRPADFVVRHAGELVTLAPAAVDGRRRQPTVPTTTASA